MILRDNGTVLGAAVVVQDLREIKQLEKEKLDAERLAAVGQTVASLSHGIKNIMTGLEGGMYVTSTGLRKGDHKRIERGWAMLERNMHRISSLAKDLLSFSRGDASKPELVDPAEILQDVVSLYEELANQNGVELKLDIQPDIAPAFLDPGGIHDCMVNLVSNAFDACLLGQEGTRRITVPLIEEATVLSFEVADTGCGMDNEVKKKAFTSFFSTKGSGGTGLGLLTTRKIVQQHGGEISFNSAPNEGTTFRLSFPRKRLPEPV
jgi:signal transduction histidine kinase